jgi:NAD-specific glutamate dehydrogenase
MLILKHSEQGIFEQSFYESSNVLYIKYVDAEQKMTILFESGRLYLYNDVPRYKYLQIRDAQSQGSAINNLLVKNGVGKKIHKEQLVKTISPEEKEELKKYINEQLQQL